MPHPNYIKLYVETLPELIERQSEEIYQKLSTRLADGVLKEAGAIVMTGCGYSYAAAANAKEIIEHVANVPAYAPYSIEASRHMELAVLPGGKNTIFVGVSGSGTVARIAEGIERFRAAGAYTVALTRNTHSRCAQQAETLLNIACPATAIPRAVPLREYTMALLAFYALAWRIAVLQGKKTEGERGRFYAEIADAARRLRTSLPKIEAQVSEFVRAVGDEVDHYELVGSGMGLVSAWLGRQELVGQAGVFGVECGAEDWLHSTFFVNHPERIGTVLISPTNSPARSRLLEVERYMQYLKRPVCLLCGDGETARTAAAGLYPVELPYTANELMNPLLEVAPVSLLAGAVCEWIGEEYSRGFRDHWDFSKDGKATEFSKIVIIP